MYYVYILECTDGTLYTGWTVNVEKRLAEHNQGKGAKYTRSRCPVVLRHSEGFSSKQEAMQREHSIKKLSRKKKVSLMAGLGL